MLKPPYRKYNLLHIYNVKKKDIIIDDPDLIGVWEEEDTLLLFFHKNKDFLIKKHNFHIYFQTCIPYNDWESGKFIKSFKIGDYDILPVWECDNSSYGEKKIIIDPSVVFGSGFHPTTRMILESFDKLSDEITIDSCIDLGCGSGILGIFAGKKGVKNICAIDNNNLSYEVSVKNFSLNKINGEIFKGDIFEYLPYNYDIVFANLYYHLLFELFEKKDFWNSEYYFLSGFIDKMEEEIISKLKKHVKILERRENNNWVMLLVKNC